MRESILVPAIVIDDLAPSILHKQRICRRSFEKTGIRACVRARAKKRRWIIADCVERGQIIKYQTLCFIIYERMKWTRERSGGWESIKYNMPQLGEGERVCRTKAARRFCCIFWMDISLLLRPVYRCSLFNGRERSRT